MATPPTFTNGTALDASSLNSVALWAMTPTTATTGATISGAKVTLTGQATYTINGVFTNDFDNYLLVARLTCSGSDVFLRFSTNGTPEAGNTYNESMMQAYQGAGVTTTRTTGGSSLRLIGNSGGFYSSASVEIFTPKLSVPTMYQAQHLRNDGSYGTPANYLFYGNQQENKSFDGITLVVNAGTIAGTLTVYGRR